MGHGGITWCVKEAERARDWPIGRGRKLVWLAQNLGVQGGCGDRGNLPMPNS
jgi:hypothetical protein